MTSCKLATDSRPTLESLMEAYQGSDEEAFRELVQRASPALRNFLSGPHVTRRQTDDLLQDCWLRVHRARHAYEAGRPVLPWLRAIARYARADEYRKMTRHDAHHVCEIDVDFLPDPRSAARATESRSELHRLLTSLPARQRQALILLKVQGMTLEEAARAIGSTIGATKQLAHRAYVHLREQAQAGDRRWKPKGEAIAARA